jgi:uncharacterized protein (TIGR02452 family)
MQTLSLPFTKLYSRYQRRNIADETISCFPEILAHKNYTDKIIRGIRNTRFYEYTLPLCEKEKWNRIKNYKKKETIIAIHNKDTLDVALMLQEQGHNPCILNFASPTRPGGGWLTGARAQEEDLFLRSTYDLSLSDPNKIDSNRKWKYPIPEKGGIYSPDVFVFRENEKNDYMIQPWENCRYVNFVAVAALRCPKLECGSLSNRDTYVTMEKIKTILRIATTNGHVSIVLGAFGCGAFKNPPRQMAQLFHQVIFSNEFKNIFERIDFAILDNPEKESNYDIFKNVFICKGKEPIVKYSEYNEQKETEKVETRFSYAEMAAAGIIDTEGEIQEWKKWININDDNDLDDLMEMKDTIETQDADINNKIDYEMNSVPWFI